MSKFAFRSFLLAGAAALAVPISAEAQTTDGTQVAAANQVAAAGDAEAVAPTDLDNLLLKPRVERLERSLLREALGRSGNNQTKAAELLGLSRFGLQKKLKRYRFA